jgi:hypothetical protein
MKIQYKPGKSHTNADAMSRWIGLIQLDNTIEVEQSKDPELSKIINNPTGGYSVINGKLMWLNVRVVVPKAWRAFVLFESHSGLLGAHSGVKRTMDKLAKKYF